MRIIWEDESSTLENIIKKGNKNGKKSAVVIAALITLLFSSIALPYSNESIEGIWQGTLKVPGAEFRIVFKLSQGPEGKQ